MQDADGEVVHVCWGRGVAAGGAFGWGRDERVGVGEEVPVSLDELVGGLIGFVVGEEDVLAVAREGGV